MSQTTSPIRATFDAQRTAITQGRQMFKGGIAFQRNAGKMSASSLQGLESLQRQQLELARAMTKSYYDGMEAMTGTDPSGGQQETVMDAFDRLEESHADVFAVVERELERGIDSFDELSEEFVGTLEEGTDQLLESHRTIEDQTVRNTEELTEGMLDGLERSQEVLDQLEDQFERQTERTEHLFERQLEGAERYQERLEEETERMQQEIRERAGSMDGGPVPVEVDGPRGGRDASTGQESAADELESIDGLGPTFRDRLTDAGIDSMDALANADVDEVAEAADVAETRAQDWIDQASS